MFSIKCKVRLQYDEQGVLRKYKIEVSGTPESLVNQFRERLESRYSSELGKRSYIYSDFDNDVDSNFNEDYEVTSGGGGGRLDINDNDTFEDNKTKVLYIDEDNNDKFVYDNDDEEDNEDDEQ